MSRAASSSPAVVGAVAGAVVGLLLVVVGVAGTTTESTGAPVVASVAPPRSVEDPVASAAFLAAWERDRRAAYALVSDFERRFLDEDGASVERFVDRRKVVQRPPDRIVVTDDAIDGRIGGDRVGCARDAEEVLRCLVGPVARSWSDELDRQREILGRYVAGTPPLYHVRTDPERPDCYELVLAIRLPAPPYGDRATFCFDGTAGYLRFVEVRRDGVVDTTVQRPSAERTPLTIPDDAVIERRGEQG